MLSKNKIKLINSLKIKKYRVKHRLFQAEGKKTVSDFIASGYKAQIIMYLKSCETIIADLQAPDKIELSDREMKKISNFSSPPEISAVFEMPQIPFPKDISDELSIYCDRVQDPGNLGTIIRTAAWFGIKNVFCSENTADVFNPKVIQASMGAVAKVRVHYPEADEFFSEKIPDNFTVFAADLQGENIYQASLPGTAILVMGNEGRGISKEIQAYISRRLYIPHFSTKKQPPESLNVAAAAAVICSEFRRRSISKTENK